MTFEGTTELTPVDHAFAAIATEFDHLVKLPPTVVWTLSTAAGWSGSCRTPNGCGISWSLIDHLLIAAAERLDLPTVLCQGSHAAGVDVGVESVER